jgi:proline racemase
MITIDNQAIHHNLILKPEVNTMLMIESPGMETSTQLDYPSRHDELNRLLSAAVVSQNFCDMLLANPEIALDTGYQGESFNLSDADRNWLFSIRSSNLVDFAANMVTYQQELNQEYPVTVPLEPVRHYVKVN